MDKDYKEVVKSLLARTEAEWTLGEIEAGPISVFPDFTWKDENTTGFRKTRTFVCSRCQHEFHRVTTPFLGMTENEVEWKAETKKNLLAAYRAHLKECDSYVKQREREVALSAAEAQETEKRMAEAKRLATQALKLRNVRKIMFRKKGKP